MYDDENEEVTGRRQEGEEARTFSIEAVHHARNEFKLVLEGEVDEVGVDENAVGRDEGGIMCQEQMRRNGLATRRVSVIMSEHGSV
jgi:hypothetical protein